MLDIIEGFFGIAVTIVICPARDEGIEFVNDLLNGGLTIGGEDEFELLKMGSHLFLLRFDQQQPLIKTNIETKKVEALMSIDNTGFLLVEA